MSYHPTSPAPSPARKRRLLVWAILLIAAVTAVVLAVVLATTKPWEGQPYKDCVSAGMAHFPNGEVGKSQIESFCHRIYG